MAGSGARQREVGHMDPQAPKAQGKTRIQQTGQILFSTHACAVKDPDHSHARCSSCQAQSQDDPRNESFIFALRPVSSVKDVPVPSSTDSWPDCCATPW